MKTDNEIIHEFMGYDWRKQEFSWRPGATTPMTIEHLNHYQTSWGWIMPVVEKIHEHGVWTIRPGYVSIEIFTGKGKSGTSRFSKSQLDLETPNDEPTPFIFLVYSVCLEFIKWHNSQKQS